MKRLPLEGSRRATVAGQQTIKTKNAPQVNTATEQHSQVYGDILEPKTAPVCIELILDNKRKHDTKLHAWSNDITTRASTV